ncbi:MAG: DAK2 domain-containing protein [Clostridia bacterium]|nr:DAK2 domain-containing protein [Clostridia bacterium]
MFFKKSEKKDSKKKTKESKELKIIGGFWLKKMAEGGAARLRSKSDEVNKLNVFPVPDGDTGDNMRMTIESGIAAVENMDSDDIAEVMKVISHGMLLGARGNSGVILSQFFAGVAKGLEKSAKADVRTMGEALQKGVEQAYASVMNPAEGTILTVARESVDYAVSRITPKSTIRSLFGDLVKEMYASLERTPEALAVLKEAGVVDSGGAGLFYIMDGFNRVLNGEQVTLELGDDKPKAKAPLFTSDFNADSVMEYGYCTELLVQLMNAKTDVKSFDIEPLKKFLGEIGNSVVCFKTDSIVKLHVHTMTPEKVLEHCRTFGEFLTIKIENMSLQHTELEAKEDESDNTPIIAESEVKESLTQKKYGIVAVTNGSGIESLYKELGTDEVVQGGQTQNPSTNDFLSAFEKVSAEHIFVFPNNGNIIMAAQQAAEIYKKAIVHVIPSKNIGTGYVAVSSADLSGDDPEKIEKEMIEAMKRVTAGYISPAIRDADMNGVHINNGDTIGIIEKEIVVSEPERLEAAKKLVAKLLEDDGKFMITAFTGTDSDTEECSALEEYLRTAYPSAEIYFVEGGQEVYPYIFVAE